MWSDQGDIDPTDFQVEAFSLEKTNDRFNSEFDSVIVRYQNDHGLLQKAFLKAHETLSTLLEQHYNKSEEHPALGISSDLSHSIRTVINFTAAHFPDMLQSLFQRIHSLHTRNKAPALLDILNNSNESSQNNPLIWSLIHSARPPIGNLHEAKADITQGEIPVPSDEDIPEVRRAAIN